MLTRLAQWWLERKAVEFSQGWIDHFFGGGKAKTGASVSIGTAMQQTAVYRAVLVIADGLAQIPLTLRRREGKGYTDAEDHPLYAMMLYRPNGWQDGVEWVRTTLMHAVATGQAISYRNLGRNDEIRELIPIRPEHTAVDVNSILDLEYTLTLENGHQVRTDRRHVFHFRGPSWDSFRGLDVIRLGREAIGLAQATEEGQARLHSNGVAPTGLFTLQGQTTQEQRDAIREMIMRTYAGGANAGKPILGYSGLSFTPIAMKGTDAQTIETRKHQIEEIARLFGVFAIMLGHAGDQSPTFASAEAFFAAHVRYTLQPWLRAFCRALDTQLLTAEERAAGLHFWMDTAELLRGSLKDRAEYYKAALGTASSPGWLSGNEIRIDDGWNPDPNPAMDQVQQPITMRGAGEKPGNPGGAADTMPGAEP